MPLAAGDLLGRIKALRVKRVKRRAYIANRPDGPRSTPEYE
jgi:hypothetical protein